MSKFSKLTRAEMKNVLGGSAPPVDVCADECSDDKACKIAGDTCTSIGTDATYCPDKKTKKVCYPAL